MKKINALIFDLGNVLIFFDWNIAKNRLNRIEENLGERTTQFLKDHKHLIYKLETGKIDEITFLKEVKKNVNSSVAEEELAKIYSEIFEENKELTYLLPELKKNYKLYLLSNTNIIHRRFGWNHYKFLDHFEKLFLSYEIGFAKPDKEIYEHVLKNIPIERDKFIYIDDIAEYVDAAKSLGWNAIKFTSNVELFKVFDSLGIKVK